MQTQTIDTQSEQLLDMLKSLGDASRLKIIRLLNDGEQTVGELAANVGLGEPTVSHHLSKLRKSELVTLRMAGNQRFYRINKGGLWQFKTLASQIETTPPQPELAASDDSWIDALGWSEDDQKVLRDYTVNGQLTIVPRKRKKLLVILRWLATRFQPETYYTEADVNEIIRAVYEDDFVSLRRELIDMGYLRRERGGGRYWLAEE